MTAASNKDKMLEKLLIEWNDTRLEYPKDKTVYELFEEQVKKTPESIAVIYGDEQLTYRVLNERANQVAHYLRGIGVVPDTPVAVAFERSVEMIIGLLGVLKAGGAYVPLDSSYPPERLQFMLDDTNTPVLLTQFSLKKMFKTYPHTILTLDEDWPTIQKHLTTNLSSITFPYNLAYIIYTSGSTGKPKGVMVEHKNLTNIYFAWENQYNLKEIKNYLQMANFSFDVFTGDWVRALCSGGKLILCPKDFLLFPEKLYHLIVSQQIEFAEFTPAVLMGLVEYLESRNFLLKDMKVLVCGSDQWLLDEYIRVRKVCSTITSIGNSYGLTETTIDSSYFKGNLLKSANCRSVPIGHQIANTQFYLLDDYLNPVPLGVEGELYIGGDGLARGYLNRSSLTAERFIPNLFVIQQDVSESKNLRLYRTGDLGRYLQDGNIEYIGRIDDQVKIRGYRIELGEIESVITTYNEIKQCIVLVRNHRVQSEQIVEADKSLVAYYIKKNPLGLNLVNEDFIAGWQKVYQEEYADIDDDNFQANFDGWISSYTEAPINHDEMVEWLEATTSRILSLKPKVVLEIGSGNGLILFKLLKNVDYYIGTDFSQNVIDYTHRVVEKFDSKNKVSLYCAAADLIPYNNIKVSYDTVIINSVVQYFPNLKYLTTVINKVIKNINVSAKIFIGDVRDYRLLECFHYSVQKFKKNQVTPREVSYFAQKDKELLISPEYFLHLKDKNNFISHVELIPKLGKSINELNCYRYDVIIHVNKNTSEKLLAVNEQNFIEVDNIIDYIKDHSNKEVLYVKYKNSRIIKDYAECQKLFNPDFESSCNQQNNLLSINEILIHASAVGYKCKLFLDIQDPLSINIILFRSDLFKDHRLYINYSEKLSGSSPCSKLSNNPALTNLMINNDFGKKIKAYLENKLPKYMVPEYYIELEKIPLTHNGKVDKKSLPAPDMDMVVAQQYVGPRDEIEQKLCEIWAEVLRLERVGIHDNFFEIGGHSLLATRVVSRIRAAYCIELPLRDLFTASTVEQLSECIKRLQQEYEGKGNINVPELKRVTRPERMPLSFAQQRLWFLDQLIPNHALYNVPMAFRLRGAFDREAFDSALRYLVDRHEVLRTRIGVYEGEGYQEIRGAQEFRVGWEDISTQSEADREVYIKEAVEREAGYRFKLGEEWLFRAHVIRVSDDVHVLMMNMHHIITDGWSFDIFLRELNVAYEAYLKGEEPGLEPLEVQYGDFAIWQRSWLQGEALERQLEYWKESLRGAPESIGLPTDYERPKELTYEGGLYTREISESLLKKVKALSESEGATLFMTLLSVLNIVLYKNSGQEDMVIGSPIANRHYKEIEGLIGLFVNTLALRTQIDPKASFREVLRRVKERTLEAYNHQDIPFEQLVDHLNITRHYESDIHCVSKLMFALQNAGRMPSFKLQVSCKYIRVRYCIWSWRKV
jgi:amino acid adenylation domain-containing protein